MFYVGRSRLDVVDGYGTPFYVARRRSLQPLGLLYR